MKKVRRTPQLLFCLFFTLGLVAPLAASTGEGKSGSIDQQSNTIKAEKLRNHLKFIASDDLEGRDTPSRGLDIAAHYLASHLANLGIRPAGDDGTYFQKIELHRTRVNAEATYGMVGDRQFTFGDDFLLQPAAADAQGSLVYASHGWIFRDREIDPYAGIDIKGKFVILDGRLPTGMTGRDLGAGRGETWFSPGMVLEERGALGAIYVAGYTSFVRWERNRERAEEEGEISVASFADDHGSDELPEVIASPALVEALFAGEKHRGNAIFTSKSGGEQISAFALDSTKTFKLHAAVTKTSEWTQNVIGVLEGSDSKLKKEYVAVGAHYDHVGIGRPVNGDAIYNGADDDGSGTVAVLAVAEAFATGPKPKRSVLFIWHAGEEKGLWGSQYFVENPTVPLDAIVTQLNIDMIGRSKPAGDTHPRNAELSAADEIYVIGSKMMSTELGALSERVNDGYLKLKFNYKYDDPDDPNRFFFRSDHFNYARKGIPIIFYFDGVHQDYHRPSDEVDAIDFGKLERVTRTIFRTAKELADAKKRPNVDKQLPAKLMSR